MSTKHLSDITTQAITAAANITVNRAGGTGSANGVSWGFNAQNAAGNDVTQLGFSSSTYTTGGGLGWVGNSTPFLYYPANFKIGTGSGSTATLVLDTSLNATFGGTITGNGSGLTTLNASNLSSGTVATARLASGTASNSAALRGDQTWASTPQTLYVETTGGTITNSTTATVLTSGGVGSLTIPANFFTAARTIRVTASGVYSTDTTPPNISIFVRFGGTTIGQVGTFAAPAGSLTNRRWSLTFLLRCSTPGSSATFIGQGTAQFNSSIGAGVVPEVGTSVFPTIDTTTTQSLNLVWQWGTAAVNNTATLITLVLEALN